MPYLPPDLVGGSILERASLLWPYASPLLRCSLYGTRIKPHMITRQSYEDGFVRLLSYGLFILVSCAFSPLLLCPSFSRVVASCALLFLLPFFLCLYFLFSFSLCFKKLALPSSIFLIRFFKHSFPSFFLPFSSLSCFVCL